MQPAMPVCRLQRAVALLIGVILLVPGCGEESPAGGSTGDDSDDLTQPILPGTNKIDVLWVVDNSNSMCQEQAALVANFDAFIAGLSDIQADFRLAVVTTDMLTDNGRFNTRPGIFFEGCTSDPPPDCPEVTGPVLSGVDYLTDPNDPNSSLDAAALQRDFACIATVGTQGSGFEKGLDAMFAALSPEMLETVNAGFRREDAWLAVVFVADENDCSEGNALELTSSFDCERLRDNLIPVDLFVDFVTSLPGTEDGDRILVAGILGPDNGSRPTDPDELRPSCTTPERGDAYAGYRYEEFIEAFAERGVVANICVDDFQVALDEMARVLRDNLDVHFCLRESPEGSRCAIGEDDCGPNAACIDPDPSDGGGVNVCSDFELVVERRASDVYPWIALPGPGDPNPAYEIDYAARCPVGISISFTPGNEPDGVGETRLRYH